MATYPRPSQCFHCGCWLVYSPQVRSDMCNLWRIHYACPGCTLGQFGLRCYYWEDYSQEEAEALTVQQNLLQETKVAREAIRGWREEVQRRDAPHIQRFWDAFHEAFPYWKGKAENLMLTAEQTASMEKYLYCLMLTFYSPQPDGSLRWEFRAEVSRGEVRLDPMHQHHDQDRDPNYLASALQEIKAHFEQEWTRSKSPLTLEAYLRSIVLQSYQSVEQRDRPRDT